MKDSANFEWTRRSRKHSKAYSWMSSSMGVPCASPLFGDRDSAGPLEYRCSRASQKEENASPSRRNYATRYILLHAGTQALFNDYLDEARHAADAEGTKRFSFECQDFRAMPTTTKHTLHCKVIISIVAETNGQVECVSRPSGPLNVAAASLVGFLVIGGVALRPYRTSRGAGFRRVSGQGRVFGFLGVVVWPM
jgi:hypothetical protein